MMNFLTKTIANRALLSSSSPQKSHFLLQTLTSIHQTSSRFVSTTTKKPKIPKPQEPSSSYVLTPPKILVDDVEKVSSWPRPKEIPFQAKVANCVSLVGFVQSHVQFEASADGMYSAGTVVAHESSDNGSVLMIPVVFLGDLAHVVACHVKQNDCVFVSGRFSCDPPPYKIMDEYQGEFHIVAENVNFVQGLKRRGSVKGREKLVYPKSKDLLLDDSDGLSGLRSDESVSPMSKLEDGGLVGGDDWRDLVKNPKLWWDCRKAKSDGIVKIRHPDFKKKDGGASLWFDNAPGWVLEGIKGLEFDVYAPKTKANVDLEAWKDLVENPDMWWDNRADKRSEKAPDFKHKNNGKPLWLSSSPDWVLSRLPPLKDQKATSSSKTFELDARGS